MLTDHLSSFLFCSSEVGVRNLEREGVTEGVHVSGDIMLDAFNIYSEIAKTKFKITDILEEKIANQYILLTIHRPVNTDSINNLAEIIAGFGDLGMNVVWPVHPRNKNVISKLAIPPNIFVTEPFSYLEMMVVLDGSEKVATDSGGLQKEAYWAKKPCVTIRTETEWIETLHNNWNILTQPRQVEIFEALQANINPSTWQPLYGNGKSGEAIANTIGS